MGASATAIGSKVQHQDNGMNGRGYIDEEDFAPGTMQRGMSRLPQQSDQAPWTNAQDYYKEKDELPDAGFDDGVLVFAIQIRSQISK